MTPSRRTSLVAALLAAQPIAAQQAPPTAHAITEAGRTLARPLDLFLAVPSPDARATERHLLIVLDPSTSVAAAGFKKELEAAVVRNKNDLAATKLGLFVIGAPRATVAPTPDFQRVVARVAAQLDKPNDQPKNLFAAVREAVPLVAIGDAAGRMLLVSLDNGEAEDAVEETGRMLKRRHVGLDVVTVEACLADSYWAGGRSGGIFERNEEPPPGAVMVGGDAPLIDLPFGFLFQGYEGNVVTPSAFAPWALARIVYLSDGGRVSLWSGATKYVHHCIFYGDCPACGKRYSWPMTTNYHEDHTEDYTNMRLQQQAPLVTSRTEAVEYLAKDPYARATQIAWRRAYDARLVEGRPSLRVEGARMSIDDRHERDRDGIEWELLYDDGARDLAKTAARARKHADTAGSIEADLAKVIAAARPGDTRQLAIAHHTRAMLLLTRVSLLALERFCTVEGPEQLRRDAAAGHKDPSIGRHARSICHGMAPYLRRLTSESLLRSEMARLAKVLDDFERSHGSSPVSFALRRMSYPEFDLWYPGEQEEPKERPKPSSDEPKGPPTGRPGRPGSTGTGGPTTGGGR